jgi:hypothetical protein
LSTRDGTGLQELRNGGTPRDLQHSHQLARLVDELQVLRINPNAKQSFHGRAQWNKPVDSAAE